MGSGILYLCPTPLGNLEDITLRVLRVLKEVDKIAAEDTRHTRKLLNYFDIHTPLTSYHEHNNKKKGPVLLEWLLSGLSVALVTDAGTPGIADPGEELVHDAVKNGIRVVPLPGPVAAVTAVTASGLPVSPFSFYGFLPTRGRKRAELIETVLTLCSTIVLYEAPHRLVKTLQELQNKDPDRLAVVARELTKIHEEFVRGTLTEVLAHFQEYEPRGECVLLLAPHEKKPAELPDPVIVVKQLIVEGLTKKEAVKEAALRLGMRRNDVYQRVLGKKE
jgi:16S rRNA (cytidine1402-2'-O)-methyltransferase